MSGKPAARRDTQEREEKNNACKELSQSLVGQDVDCYGHRYQDKEAAESPMICNEYGAIQQGQPQSRDCNNFDSERYGLVFCKISYVASKTGMVHQPVI